MVPQLYCRQANWLGRLGLMGVCPALPFDCPFATAVSAVNSQPK